MNGGVIALLRVKSSAEIFTLRKWWSGLLQFPYKNCSLVRLQLATFQVVAFGLEKHKHMHQKNE